ncbi:MAG: hypothetical protein H7X97_01210 [Opitutaceae bacterium]|nr:hypothetical protein [Verrucomicrobiales bacterium]
MLRVKLAFILSVCLAFIPLLVNGGTYTLADGQTEVSGDPISYNDNGVVLRSASGSVQSRMAWASFSQASLKILASEARNPKDAAFVEPFIEELIQQKSRRKEITIQPIDALQRPTGRLGLLAAFSGSVGLMILAVLYGANLFAAVEIARFRRLSVPAVCAVSAVIPIVGPIIFLCLPTTATPAPDLSLSNAGGPPRPPTQSIMGRATQATAQVIQKVTQTLNEPIEPLVVQAPPPETPTAPLPPAQIFAKGEFTFNRRFFEGKFPGFFRLVPSEAEKDLLISIKAVRGQFTGRYISRINQTELCLQVFKNDVTADEMIPFIEIQEVVVRHKDSILQRS